MKIIFYFIPLLFYSCSASWHLKQAIKKGAEVTNDTIEVVFIKDSVVHDTTLQNISKFKYLNDTIKIYTDRYRIKFKYDTITKNLYHNVFIPSDTIYKDVSVPISINAPPRNNSIWLTLMKLFNAPIIVLIFILLFLLFLILRKR